MVLLAALYVHFSFPDIDASQIVFDGSCTVILVFLLSNPVFLSVPPRVVPGAGHSTLFESTLITDLALFDNRVFDCRSDDPCT